ncbi:MAG: ATP-binding protein, partial [Rubrivivax sp.]
PLPTDVQAFRAAIAQGDWATALALHQGDFLQGLAFPGLTAFEDWLAQERQDVARAWRAALLAHGQDLERQGEWLQAETWLERLVRADPIDEPAVQGLMRVLHASGRPEQAEDTFERLRAALRAELGVEPMAATRALAERLRSGRAATPAAAVDEPVQGRGSPGLPASAKADPPVEAPRSLPMAGGPFVGRTVELQALSQQLAQPDCRMLTVVGLGGMGKTRLALEAARLQATRFADGAAWAHLADVARADLLVPRLAAAVGLVPSGPADPQRQLVNFLRGRQVLLVLDNFEHLLDQAALLETLLREAPGLRLIVTSRVPLHLPDEWLFDLDGLACPPESAPAEALAGFDAVKLFLGRAGRFRARQAPDDATLRHVAALVRRVEGMPLALELAASWTRVLDVGQIVQRLQQGEDLLRPAGPEPAPRQRGVQAVLASSWALLSPAEQGPLAALSVFRGSFALEAAEAVAAAPLGVLLRLVNLSLVRRQDDGRFDLHELVRQFADRQEAAFDRVAVRARFSAHYLGELQRLGRAVRVAITPDTVAEVRREISHLLAALEHEASAGRPEALGPALLSFHAVIEIAGLFKVGLTQVDALVVAAQARGAADPMLLGQLDAVRAHFHVKVGEDGLAERHARSALERLGGAPPSDFVALALGALGICSHFAGRFEEAVDRYAQALQVAEATGNRSEQCRILNRMAAAMNQLDRQDASDRHYERALEIARAIGDLSEEANVLNNFGINFESSGRVDDAIRMYQGSLEISDRIQFQRVKSAALTNLGHVHERRGQFAQARRFYEQSLEIKAALGEPVAIVISMTNLADVLYALGEEGAGHRTNFRALSLALSAHALAYAARAVWSFAKFFVRAGLVEQALLLACFLRAMPDREQWVQDEAEGLIARHAPAVPAAVFERVGEEARRLDCQGIADWLGRQPRLRTDTEGA